MNYRYHIHPGRESLPASEGTRNAKIIESPLGLTYTVYHLRYMIYGITGAIDVRQSNVNFGAKFNWNVNFGTM